MEQAMKTNLTKKEMSALHATANKINTLFIAAKTLKAEKEILANNTPLITRCSETTNCTLDQFKTFIASTATPSQLTILASPTTSPIRLQFRDNLGLPKSLTKNGYKQGETEEETKLQLVVDAMQKFEALCNQTGKYYDTLAKMQRNLRNAPRAARFMQIQKELAKKVIGQTETALTDSEKLAQNE